MLQMVADPLWRAWGSRYDSTNSQPRSRGSHIRPRKTQGQSLPQNFIQERKARRITEELETDKSKAEYQWGAPLGKDDNGIRQPGDTKANLLPQPGNALADPNKGNPIALRDSQLLASRIKNLQNATSIPDAQKKLAIDDVQSRITDPVAWQKAMLKLALLPTQTNDDLRTRIQECWKTFRWMALARARAQLGQREAALAANRRCGRNPRIGPKTRAMQRAAIGKERL